MLKQSKSPDGYKHLLVYKKAEELLSETLNFTATFPSEKTINDLEDQMNRSARSVKANIVEGWKRNATHEYYTFLGYSVASNAELLEDYLDICLGRYEAKGVRGEMGKKGREKLETLRFYPLDPLLPISVRMYLHAKELNFLLENLQKALAEKMQDDHTLSSVDRLKLAQRRQTEDEEYLKKAMEKAGVVMTARGVMAKEKAAKLGLEKID